MKRRIKLNYNGLISEIDEALASIGFDDLPKSAWSIDIGLDILDSYMKELAQHAIDTEDEWLIEWCKNLLIVTENEEAVPNAGA